MQEQFPHREYVDEVTLTVKVFFPCEDGDEDSDTLTVHVTHTSVRAAEFNDLDDVVYDCADQITAEVDRLYPGEHWEVLGFA